MDNSPLSSLSLPHPCSFLFPCTKRQTNKFIPSAFVFLFSFSVCTSLRWSLSIDFVCVPAFACSLMLTVSGSVCFPHNPLSTHLNSPSFSCNTKRNQQMGLEVVIKKPQQANQETIMMRKPPSFPSLSLVGGRLTLLFFLFFECYCSFDVGVGANMLVFVLFC
ncbi:MAG: hypothetical protein J3R72DRAFT_85353 [Linnemannia gamsii]|nr:MAG: hypothetical protein J3R72DRAFT_85353 [Linnemannia gamsii]